MKHDEKLVLLTTQPTEKAQLIKNLLEQEGIIVSLQNIPLMQPFMTGIVKVKLAAKDKAAAVEVLNRYPEFKENIEPDNEAARTKAKILVPIDFSDYSKRATTFAFNMAKASGATVTLLHAYFTPFFPGTFPDSDTFGSEIQEEEASREIQDRIQKAADKFSGNIRTRILAGELPDIPFEFIITQGIPEEEIHRWSKQYKPVMIVMGTRGKNQKEVDLIGSVTAEVIDSSHVPVFAIPENTDVKSAADIKRIAFVTNFDQRDLFGFKELMDLPGFNDKKVSFLYLVEKKQEPDPKKMQGIKDYFEKNYAGLDISYGMVEEEQLLSKTDEFIRKHNIDTLVLTTHKRNIFARLFNPSIAHKVVFHTDTPLLVIRN